MSQKCFRRLFWRAACLGRSCNSAILGKWEEMGLLRQGKLENTLLVQFALRPQTMPRSNKKGGRHICGKPGIWRQFQRVNGVGGALLTICYLLVMNWDRRVKLLNLHLARNDFKFFFLIILSWACEIDMCASFCQRKIVGTDIFLFWAARIWGKLFQKHFCYHSYPLARRYRRRWWRCQNIFHISTEDAL